MKSKYITLNIIITIIIIHGWLSCNFAPGSYPYAEKYSIEVTDSVLINAVQEFKKNNPEYCIPEYLRFIDGKSDDRDDHWYHIYFYYKTENEIVNSWIRKKDKNNTTFALVAINVGSWKEINNDFSSYENDRQKQKFEQRILIPIKELLKNKQKN